MASVSKRRTCDVNEDCKQVGIAYCEGCSRSFCGKHFDNHRRRLHEELNIIFDVCNEVTNTLNLQKTICDDHPAIKEINEWEKQSIDKIKEKACELRQQVVDSEKDRRSDLSEKLKSVVEKSREAREYDSFSETDLHQWNIILEDLKSKLVSSTISLDEFDLSQQFEKFPFTMTSMKELFERTSDNTVNIEENGQVVICTGTDQHREIRGKIKYVRGVHKIRLIIESTKNIWMMLGINSEAAPLKALSYNSPSTYGWSSNNNIWTNGNKLVNPSSSVIEMKRNNIICLIFDCNKRMITMINESTNKRHEQPVDIDRCPFPWQLHINLYEGHSRVRLLPN